MPEVFKTDEFSPKFNDTFFFDTNVWMYLYCPLGNYSKDKKQKQYSSLLNEILNRKSGVFINSLVLSEFANAYLRIDFELWRKLPENIEKNSYKRDFVKSHQFKTSVSDVKTLIRNILKISERSGDEFNAINLEDIFNEFGNSDFNDSYYIALAQMKNFIIVTDDADFFSANKSKVRIITAGI